MKHTFFIHNPKVEKSTILFSTYFRKEKKQFKYPIKKSILIKDWDFKNNCPFNKGKDKAPDQILIKAEMNRYSEEFLKLQSRLELVDEDFTSMKLKKHFNKVFKKGETNQANFFEVYDLFTKEKQMRKLWTKSTIKRYQNIKNILVNFEKVTKYKLNFTNINNEFYSEFSNFCYDYKNHYTNTFSRNVGLFKTFMFWAVKMKYTYNETFKDFVKPVRVLTREEALTLKDIKHLYNYNFENKELERARDIFVFQSLIGMRYGDLKLINSRTINDKDCILLKEEKDSAKPTREIPLMSISKAILEKYDYKLPLLTNQKQNDWIKKVMEKAGFDHEVEYTRTKGVQQVKFIKKFSDRISTHTARRSFITIMRNKGIADKTIMSITGHKDFKTFNMYHQVDNNAKIDAVKSVFENF